MNIEIKFRLHDKEGCIIGYEFHEKNQYDCYQIYHSSLRGDWVFNDEKKLVREGYFIAATYKCQFTGLKDKNGTDIYEGDILRYRNRLGKVVWHKYQASFDLVFIKNIEGEPFIAMKEGMDNNKWSFETVIVGNIHQNKELLNNH